jgi:hypothetical protein
MPVNSPADRIHLDIRVVVGIGAGAIVACFAALL